MPTGVYKRDYKKIYTKEHNANISRALISLKENNLCNLSQGLKKSHLTAHQI